MAPKAKTVKKKPAHAAPPAEEATDFFNDGTYKSFTEKYGIELLSNSTDNIQKEECIIPAEFRKTSEIMTYHEYTRVISERAKQIENGAYIFVDVVNEQDPAKIAEKEIRNKKCPLKITRALTKNIKEEWAVNEMIIPFGV